MHFLIVFLSLVLTSVGEKTDQDQFFIIQPRSVKARLGQSLVLPCKIGNRQGPCQWTKNGLGLGEEFDLPGHPRYHMEECSLKIDPVLVEDEGKYQCQVKPGLSSGKSSTLQSKSAEVHVEAEPNHPHIQQARNGDMLVVKQLHNNKAAAMELKCESLGARPAATISWQRDDRKEVVESKSEITKMKDTGTFRTVSTVFISPVTNMNISCTARNEVDPIGKTSNKLLIRIHNIEKVKLDLSSSQPNEEDTIFATCSTIVGDSQAYVESPLSYSWFLGGREIMNKGKDPEVLSIIASRQIDGMEISCAVSNSVGRSSLATKKIDVLYGPVITKQPVPRIKYAIKGERVTFTCEAESKPESVLIWVSQKTGEMNYGTTLSLTASEEHSGEDWYCRAYADGFKPVDSNPVQVRLVNPPKIIRLDEAEVGPGEVMLTCVAESVAPDTHIYWRMQGSMVDMSDPAVKTVLHKEKDTHHSYLILSEAKEKNNYSCHVSNEAGMVAQTLVSVLEENNMNYYLVIILPVVVVGAILSSILSCFCCFFHQRYTASTINMEVEKMRNKRCDVVEPCLLDQTNTDSGVNRTFKFDGLSASPSCASFNTTTSTLPSVIVNSP